MNNKPKNITPVGIFLCLIAVTLLINTVSVETGEAIWVTTIFMAVLAAIPPLASLAISEGRKKIAHMKLRYEIQNIIKNNQNPVLSYESGSLGASQ